MSRISKLLLVGATAIISACSSSRGDDAKAPVDVASGSEKAAPEEDRSPVAAPADLFAVARVTDGSELVDTLSTWGGFPLDWRKLLAKEMPGVEGVILLDAPLEFAAMLDPASGMEPRVFYAFSVGVSSVDETLAFFRRRGEIVQRSARRIRFSGDLTCAVHPAVGRAPSRLVCSDEEEAIEVMGPYMARGLPNATLGTGHLVARLEAEPFRARYGNQLAWLKTAGVPFVRRELAVDHPPLDEALRDLLYMAADEVIDIARDLERLETELSIKPNPEEIDLRVTLSFKGTASWVAQTTADASSRARAAPDVFWQLPETAAAASFTSRIDAARFERATRALEAVVDGALDYLNVGPAQRKPVVDAFSKVWHLDRLEVQAEMPLAHAAASSSADNSAELAWRQALGSHLLYFATDDDRYPAFLRALTKLSENRQFRAAVAKHLDGVSPDDIPKMREKKPAPSAGLPPGTSVFELTVPSGAFDEAAKAKGRRKPLTAVVIFAPVPGGTWAAVGPDEASLGPHLKAALAPAGGQTLAAVPELRRYKAEPVLAGGFETVRGLVDDLSSSIDPSNPGAGSRASELSKIIAAMPRGGRVPLTWESWASSEGPRAGAVLHVPKAAVQDLAGGVLSGVMGDFGR